MAMKRVASTLRHVTAFNLIMLIFGAIYAAAAGRPNSLTLREQHNFAAGRPDSLILRERHYNTDDHLHVYPSLQRSYEEAEELDEPHPADELLQSQNADGSQSYILGGY